MSSCTQPSGLTNDDPEFKRWGLFRTPSPCFLNDDYLRLKMRLTLWLLHTFDININPLTTVQTACLIWLVYLVSHVQLSLELRINILNYDHKVIFYLYTFSTKNSFLISIICFQLSFILFEFIYFIKAIILKLRHNKM